MADYDNARVAAIEKKLKKRKRPTDGAGGARGEKVYKMIPPASVRAKGGGTSRKGAEDDAYVNYRSGRTGGNVRAPLSKMVPGDTRSRKGGPG